MKIGYTGVDLPEGKVKYEDDRLAALASKDKPKKVSPYFAEFLPEEFGVCDAIVLPSTQLLDVLILDIEKLEIRQQRVSDDAESALLQRCLERLEEEVPLCDMDLSPEESELVALADPYSLKPVIGLEGGEDVNEVIAVALERAGYMFFYTSGSNESHAWLVPRGTDIVTCAGKIHTDLARGFIRGDVVSFEDYMASHNFNECRSKGLAKLADRDYVVQPGEVLEIRFNV